jgi:hypothetical protein
MTLDIEIPIGIEGCVYKLWYNDRYVIIKCKTLQRSIFGIKTDLHYFFKETRGGQREANLYYDFYSYIESNQSGVFQIEIILASNHPLELLKSEHIALEEAYVDERCLNKDFNVYIPKFTQVNGKKSWINRGYYLNFMIWRKKREQNTIKG